MSRFFPHTPADIAVMLESCRANTLDDLYSDVPEQLRLRRDYDLPSQMSEDEVRRYFASMAAECTPCAASAEPDSTITTPRR